MELLLKKNELLYLDDARGSAVRCGCGSLWLTQPGDSRDHLLASGDETRITSRGRIVLLALQESRVQMLPKKQQTDHSLLLHTSTASIT